MAASTKIHTWQKAGKGGKSLSELEPAQPPRCPECTSHRIWKNGFRYVKTEAGELPVQRYLCRLCGRRFSEQLRGCGCGFSKSQIQINITGQSAEASHSGKNVSNLRITSSDFSPEKELNGISFDTGEDVTSHRGSSSFTGVAKPLKALSCYNSKRQVCVSEQEMKNLSHQRTRVEKQAAGATTKSKGKIIEYLWWMKKEGFAESTITRRVRLLETLNKRGADLLDVESVKLTMARQEGWNPTTKEHAVTAYTSFLNMLCRTWKPPKYNRVRKLPFIPTEEEVDQLIAGCNRKTSALLQLLKETGMRSGEAWSLKWTDFNFKNRSVSITPEKGGDPRVLPVSTQLVAMLQAFPKKSRQVFVGSLRHFRRSFRRQRERIATKLQNPRVNHITFHTLRHWKATMEYH